ncbi:hypothetical protein KEM55_006733, partial [Ascosphaera atra]
MRWVEPDSASLGYTRFGYTSCPGVDDENCVVITLNEHLKRLGNWGGDILAVLIHEMAHAYFLVCCGWREKAFPNADAREHDLEHDINYCALLFRIQEVLNVTFATYTDLFLCLPLQNDHPAVHDVPPFVSGRSCCDWMGINRPSDEDIQSYLWSLMDNASDDTKDSTGEGVEAHTPQSSINEGSRAQVQDNSGGDGSRHGNCESTNGYLHQSDDDHAHGNIAVRNGEPLVNGNHVNGIYMDATRYEQLEAKLQEREEENRKLREALQTILQMVLEGRTDKGSIQVAAKTLGIDLPPLKEGVLTNGESSHIEHANATTPRGHLSPARGASESLRDALDPQGQSAAERTGSNASSDCSNKP